ncbi:TetR/AcrR family transcriptional regulator [Pontibacter arcticus]|uniref:TetR/AcrR family transcriptional regulator n=1 Tax=Pontibacter arcticus TaxID=2080288 RepID=A0A364RJ48_9BACT|nr:TetR/AcrR family transcriptional regulator [Pontibacter arcticus]RAU84304.1 TetR/AcrR family transcriptional regulator [Pontibacter arcticus]
MTFLETILGEILRIFKQYGIEANSEDEIARMLDIRQSTFRELFANKADMVKQVVEFDIEQQKKEQADIHEKAANPVEEMMLLLTNGIKRMHEINPVMIQEMNQSYPQAWAISMDYLSNHSQHLNAEVLNRGILSGYFRKDINIQLVTKILLEQFHMLINPAVFPPERYNLAEVFRSVYLYYVRGICTETGGKLAEEYFSKNNL